MNANNQKGLDRILKDVLSRAGDGHARVPVASSDHGALVAAMSAARKGDSLVMVVPSATVRDRTAHLVRYLLENGPVPYVFPSWPRGAQSPYEEVVESPFVAAARLGALGILSLSNIPFAMVIEVSTAARRVMSFDSFMDGAYRLEAGRELDLTEFADHLVRAGYHRASTVADVGEFSVRGGIVDFYSPFAEDPVRMELDGDDIAAIKGFDPATQRCRRSLASTWVVPVWEVPAEPGGMREAMIRLGDLAASRSVPSGDVARVETAMEAGRMPVGFSAMTPVVLGSMDLPLSYVTDNTIVAVFDPVGCRAGADSAMDDLAGEYGEHADEPRLMARPEELAARGGEALDALSDRPHTLYMEHDENGGILGSEGILSYDTNLALATASDIHVRDRVVSLAGFVKESTGSGRRVLITCPNESEAGRVRDVLASEGFEPEQARRNGIAELLHAGEGIRVGLGRLRDPIAIDLLSLVVVPSESVFGVKDAMALRPRRKGGARRLTEYRELEPGDLVIHREHGIGRFRGLEEIDIGDGRRAECLALTYKSGDRLLVPVERADVLDRYTAPTEAASKSLDRLGGQSFIRRKKSAKKAARRIAGMLEAIYAKRVAGTTHAFPHPDAQFREFEATFRYETTRDQENAIEEVLDDMARDRPMDRLVCGDVGFGKTEVAVRAAYHAAMEGKQVAVLVPTTLLAEQHRLTFAARLRNTPITVQSLSRFKGSAGVRHVLDGLKGGSVDIVIGTHRLLSRDVAFRDLGLLIVDEEHRFGVAHKERLREIAATVHTLTLTATPIPRTLHMALAGIRDLSIISTPPRDRLAVRTFVARNSLELMRSAILREINRGGQVFVVHNRVEDIFDFARGLSSAVPEAGFGVAHGQMSSGDLEGVMSAFVRGDKDVLVCTTIIESGLDIGTANTMLIHNAGSFGLAQLYQLRGRVGRASERAYCYLLVHDPSSLTGEARKRVEAIERFSELASGFNLATMDLEIRGAGNVLGAEQSGHMAAVGFDLFMEMLDEAIRELSGEEVVERVDTELKHSMEARIPTGFVPDEKLRLRLYKRLSSASDILELNSLSAEIVDRFGTQPVPVSRLIGLMRIKLLGRMLGLARVGLSGKSLELMAASSHEGSIDRVMDAVAGMGLGTALRKAPLELSLAFTDAAGDPLEVGEALLHAAAVDGNEGV